MNGSELNLQNKNCIKLLSLNICGLCSKINDPIILNEFEKYDILCLSETKTDNADTDFLKEKFNEIEFNIVVNNRYELSKRKSGGLIIAYKRALKEYITVKIACSNTIQWIVINKMCLKEGLLPKY